MHGSTLLDLGGLAQELRERVGDLCGYPEDFIVKYLANAALSLVEEMEQELLLAMRYDDYVEVRKDDVLRRVAEYLDVLSRACNGRSIMERVPDLDRLLRESKVFESALCSLYSDGISGDGVPSIVIDGVDRGSCLEELSRRGSARVRSRFSELSHYLFRLKQRFKGKSSFEAKRLVSRVFAFCEQRRLPVPKHNFEDLAKELKYVVSTIYKELCSRVLSGSVPCETPGELLKVVDEFLEELARRYGLSRFYGFQLEGIRVIGRGLIDAVTKGDDSYVTLEAPTGSGKSEVFLLSAISLALVKRFLCRNLGLNRCRSPVVMIVYPRLALARNQFERLVRYVTALNEILKRMGMPDLEVSISVNNMDVLESSKYVEVLGRHASIPPGKCVETEVSSRYTRIPVEVCRDHRGVFIRYTDKYNPFKCLDGSYPEVICYGEECRILCGGTDLSFVKLFKNVVKGGPGDIHVTLFETLRLNILSRSWSALFGDGDVVGGPLMVVLDEIHTYTGIVGARYAYMLRRLMARSRYTGRRTGFVVVGLSATIPEGSEGFLRDLFGLGKEVKTDRVKPSEDELIPLGADYFYIVLPNFKELVELLSVSIQTVMALHFNFLPFKPEVKKSLVFVDSLDVASRLRYNLYDAITQKSLQDLRNPLSDLFEYTVNDYGDSKPKDLVGLVKELGGFKSWLDGELWWPYALECEKHGKECQNEWRSIRVHTSKLRERVEGPGVVIATSTLEVGVDYEDVSVVYQHGAPPSIASLIQRAGRGGRRVYENPLLRSVIAIQLSPEIPHQAYLLELFTRYKSLREALDKEVLLVATRNKHVKVQTALEAVLDYYVASGRSTSIDETRKFECEHVPSFINEKRGEVVSYVSKVLGSDTSEVEELLEEALKSISDYCERGGRP